MSLEWTIFQHFNGNFKRWMKEGCVTIYEAHEKYVLNDGGKCIAHVTMGTKTMMTKELSTCIKSRINQTYINLNSTPHKM
jgi:hypothetical protein